MHTLPPLSLAQLVLKLWLFGRLKSKFLPSLTALLWHTSMYLCTCIGTVMLLACCLVNLSPLRARKDAWICWISIKYCNAAKPYQWWWQVRISQICLFQAWGRVSRAQLCTVWRSVFPRITGPLLPSSWLAANLGCCCFFFWIVLWHLSLFWSC